MRFKMGLSGNTEEVSKEEEAKYVFLFLSIFPSDDAIFNLQKKTENGSIRCKISISCGKLLLYF